MPKLCLIICIFLSAITHGQTLTDIAYFPVYDSMGIPSYISKSHVAEYKNPKKTTRIPVYNQKLDLVGYWVGTKRRFIKATPTK